MPDILAVIAARGGAAKTVELRQSGFTPRQLAAAVRSGLVLRPRKAWYVDPATSRELVTAVRVGGRATCLSALHRYGVWLTEPVRDVHVAVHREASRLRAAESPHLRQVTVRDAVVHWSDTPRPRRHGSRLLEDPVAALRDVADCLLGDDLFATVESALHLGVVTMQDWNRLLASLPLALRRDLAAASRLSGSGLESLFVRRVRPLGIPLRQQVQIGIDRVDVLLGERLVVELDGERFHDRRSDYARNVRLIAADYHVLRFDYDLVVRNWAWVERAVLAAIIRGAHRR